MKDFYVREYALISVEYQDCPASNLDHAYVSQSAFDALCDLAAEFSRSGAKLLVLAGRKSLKLDQYVGVIETPCGTRLEILPKHIELQSGVDHQQQVLYKARQLLQDMLNVALSLKARDVGAASLQHFNYPIYDWVMQQFLVLTQQLIQQGLRFDYQRVSETQPYLRGQLRQAQVMRQSPAQRHLFPIDHDVFIADRAENRLIKTALEKICRQVKNAKLWQLAQELRLMMQDIPRSQQIQQDFNCWRSDRLLKHYQQIKPWCELILNEYMPVATRGNHQGMSLLFPMNVLFERYVAHHLQAQLPQYRVMLQHASQHICSHQKGQIFKLKPDIYIEGQGKQYVLDTKWKLINQHDRSGRYGLKDSDIQQMFAYSHFYLAHQSDVILIYPKHKDFDRALAPFQFNTASNQARLLVLAFDLDKKQLLDFNPDTQDA